MEKETYFNKRRLTRWAVVFIFVTLMALMNIGVIMTDEMAYGKTIPFQYPLINELTGFYTILLLLPLVLWFFKKFPIRRRNLLSHIPLYLLVSMVFGVCHTFLMSLSRNIIYPLAGLKAYNPGSMVYRILMEYHKQLLTFWFIFAVFTLIRYVQKNQERQLRTAQLEEQLTKARLQALQVQLNPHFLFNTLNMISSTMYENVKAADKMITYLSDLLRITLSRANRQEYALNEELELLHLYIEIMNARFRDNLTIHMNIDSKSRQALVPAFILQPLVENSIKHSMENLETTEITITSQKKDNRVVLLVADNGPGIQGHPDKAIANGFGLANIVERLEKLYGNHQQFQLENLDVGGLQVTVEIPYRHAVDTPAEQGGM